MIEENIEIKVGNLVKEENRRELDLVLVRYLTEPLVMKDLIQYLDYCTEISRWLKNELKERPVHYLWFESYKRIFPREILAAHEFATFSSFPVGKNQSRRYGLIDLVLHINFSNIKGFSQTNGGIKEFLQKESQSFERRLYLTSGEWKWNNGEIYSFSLLNPPKSEVDKWRTFHIKMREITFHFLIWLVEINDEERLSKEMLQYGKRLSEKEWKVSSLVTIQDRLMDPENRESMDNDRLHFFLGDQEHATLFERVNRDNAVTKLKEIFSRIDTKYRLFPDESIFMERLRYTDNLPHLYDYSEEMSDLYELRCCQQRQQ